MNTNVYGGVMRRAPAGVVVGCLIAWGYSLGHFFKTGVLYALTNSWGDFLFNFPAAPIAAWANRFSWYADGPIHTYHPSPQWSYGPFFNLVTLPLLLFESLTEAYRVLLVVNYGFLVLSGWLLYRLAIATRVTLVPVTIFGFLLLNYFPLYEALIQRNIEIFELLLIVWAMTLYARRRDARVGVLIGVAAMTKILPGIFVPYLALKRRWRAFWAAVIVMGVIGILTQPLLGWQHSWVVKAAGRLYTTSHLNQAVSGPVIRLAGTLGVPEYGVPISLALIAILAILLCWVMWRFRHHEHWKLEWSLLLVAMIMLPQYNQNYYLTFLLVPYAVLLGMVLRQEAGRPSKAVLGISFFLTGWPIPLSLVDRVLGPLSIERLLAASISFWGVALLVFMLVRALRATVPSSASTH